MLISGAQAGCRRVSRTALPGHASGADPGRLTKVPEPDAHVPVLLPEALAALRPGADSLLVDCTFGRGGHSRALLERLGPSGRVLAMDRDPAAVAAAREMAAADPRLVAVQAPFASLEEAFRAAFGERGADGVLFDLGVSSPQLADPGRGFSFRHDGPLDMRMDPEEGDSAADWLGAASEGRLVEVLQRLGEEPRAKRIARAIVERRARSPIRRTRELADLVARVVGAGGGGAGRTPHPATATFRALRMEVNQELQQLERGLEQAARILSKGGRIVVISFHSLEDRMVKRFIRDHGRGPPVPRALPVEAARLPPPAFRSMGRAIRPGQEEVERNPRARSACMRGGVRQ